MIQNIEDLIAFARLHKSLNRVCDETEEWLNSPSCPLVEAEEVEE